MSNDNNQIIEKLKQIRHDASKIRELKLGPWDEQYVKDYVNKIFGSITKIENIVTNMPQA